MRGGAGRGGRRALPVAALVAAPLAAALLAAGPLGPAPALAASLFSTAGLGETVSPASARGRALGGVLVSLADSQRVSLENPALLAGIGRVSISALYVAERRAAKSDAASETFNDGTFPYLHGAVPLGRLVVGFGLLREQNLFVNPLVRARAETPAPHTVRFERRGDIFRVPAALAIRLGPRVAVGGSFDFWFGSIEETRVVDFDDRTYRDTRDETLDEMDGIGSSAGILVTPHPSVSVGARFRAEETLSGDRTTSTADGGGTRQRVEHTMPASIAAGATIAPRPGLRAAVEVRRDLWEGAAIDAPDGRGLGAGSAAPASSGFTDATRLALGLEVDRAGAEAFFLRRFPWRVGYHRGEWHVRDAAGHRITEWFVTGGTSFALGRRVGALDLFGEWGRRGSLDKNGLEERILRLGVGVSAGEPWKRPERRGRRGTVKLPPEVY